MSNRILFCVSLHLTPPRPGPGPDCRYDLTENDLFAIWASDGVWEFLQNEDVAKILATHTPNWDAAIGAVIEVRHAALSEKRTSTIPHKSRIIFI